MEKYTIEFTKKQLEIVAKGLEFYSRFLSGQWRIPDEMQYMEYKNQEGFGEFWNKRNAIEGMLDELSAMFRNSHKNSSHGIGSENLHENAKTAYDIYRPILEEFQKDAEEYNVYSSPGLKYSAEGRIKVDKI